MPRRSTRTCSARAPGCAPSPAIIPAAASWRGSAPSNCSPDTRPGRIAGSGLSSPSTSVHPTRSCRSRPHVDRAFSGILRSNFRLSRGRSDGEKGRGAHPDPAGARARAPAILRGARRPRAAAGGVSGEALPDVRGRAGAEAPAEAQARWEGQDHGDPLPSSSAPRLIMRHTISVLVENEFGVLSRVAGLFSGRGFNIESLCVAETLDPTVSRITLVTRGEDQVLEQIEKQLNKLICVIKVTDFVDTEHVERELVLIKVAADERTRGEL